MDYKELEAALANARSGSLADTLSAHDKALIKHLAPIVRELIESETAPLKRKIAELETLTSHLLRPPSRERGDRGDARGPNFPDWQQ